METVIDSLGALGESRRRTIFELLAAEPASVGSLAKRLPAITRPAISQHLRVLVDAGLVTYRSVGTRNIYRVDPEGIATLRAYLDSLWNKALADLKVVAEESFLKAKRTNRKRGQRHEK
jgi:DNA-binding transcriptional ArsR family regulator